MNGCGKKGRKNNCVTEIKKRKSCRKIPSFLSRIGEQG
ncbi:hypothetical protein M076_0518 [Bacteroides fragilis str. 2-F-2 |uniref:Uncharacterized protein n=1 Tax=Bacteroides fragilis str. 2-F-2 \|nr:hypothetical protein M077_0517 [Bacteroides fragilis str. 2-F-2 \